jgi:glyceraldehyde 3-phosphate dehydrogenase
MAIKLGINGFGRIGRNIFRALSKDPLFADIVIVGINDLTDAKTITHLMKYDSVMGRSEREISCTENTIVVDGQSIPLTGYRKPGEIPWNDMGAEYILECVVIFVIWNRPNRILTAGLQR